MKMTEEEYRAYPAVNKSTLWEIRKSPMHYRWALENPGEDTPALKMGRAVHAAALEPDEFEERYITAPEGIDRRTKEGKAAWVAFMEQAEGKEILTSEEMNEVRNIAENVRTQAGWLLKGCRTEVPLIWVDPRTGVECKCRLDAVKEEGGKIIVIDLKTTGDAELKSFTRNAIKYGYHVQAAHYLTGVRELFGGNRLEWWFIAVEKKAPYAVNLIKASEGFIEGGQYVLMDLMNRLVECRQKDEWPGYGESLMTLPEWALEDGEE